MAAVYEMMAAVPGTNWHAAEEKSGLTFRWTGPGHVSRFSFPGRLQDGDQISLEVAGTSAQLLEQGLRFLVDYTETPYVTENQGRLSRCLLRVPQQRLLQDGPTQLHIYVDHVQAAREDDPRQVGLAVSRVVVSDDQPHDPAATLLPARPSIDFFLSAHLRSLCSAVSRTPMQDGLRFAADRNYYSTTTQMEYPLLTGRAQQVEVTATLFRGSGRLLVTITLTGAQTTGRMDCIFHLGVLRVTADEWVQQSKSFVELLSFIHMHVACIDEALQADPARSDSRSAGLWAVFTACLSQLGQAVSAPGSLAIRLLAPAAADGLETRLPDSIPLEIESYELLTAAAEKDEAADYRHIDIRYRVNGQILSMLGQLHYGAMSVEIRNFDLSVADFDDPGRVGPLPSIAIYRGTPPEEQSYRWHRVPHGVRMLVLMGFVDHHYLVYDRLCQTTSQREARQWLDYLRDCGQWLEDLEYGPGLLDGQERKTGT